MDDGGIVSLPYSSELTVVQPGSFVRTKVDLSVETCEGYLAEHFLTLNTVDGSV